MRLTSGLSNPASTLNVFAIFDIEFIHGIEDLLSAVFKNSQKSAVKPR